MSLRRLLRVLLLAALLFAALNIAWAAHPAPLDVLGRVSIYGRLVPHRARLPRSNDANVRHSAEAHNLPTALNSHRVMRPAAPGEFRVAALGDSALWGVLLQPGETLSARLNAMDLRAPDGRRVVFDNLGTLQPSVLRDLLLLDALHHAQRPPDAVLWFVTAQALRHDQQFTSPYVYTNPVATRRLLARYQLHHDDDSTLQQHDWRARTILAQRRDIAGWLRLQLTGFAYAATGTDILPRPAYTPVARDLAPGVAFAGFDAPQPLAADDFALDVIMAGVQAARGAPVLLVNQPIFRSDGANSDLRYNALYPRWAYDAYRDVLHAEAAARGWPLLDLWDAVPPEAFTDSSLHYNAAAAQDVAARVGGWLVQQRFDGARATLAAP